MGNEARPGRLYNRSLYSVRFYNQKTFPQKRPSSLPRFTDKHFAAIEGVKKKESVSFPGGHSRTTECHSALAISKTR